MHPIGKVLMSGSLALALSGCTVVELIKAAQMPPAKSTTSPRPLATPSGTAPLAVPTPLPLDPSPGFETLTIDDQRVTVFSGHKVSPMGIFPSYSQEQPPKAGDYTIEVTLLNFYGLKRGFSPADVRTVSLHMKHFPKGYAGGAQGWRAMNLEPQAAKLRLDETGTRLKGAVDATLEGYGDVEGQKKRVRYVFDLPYTNPE